MPLTASPPAVVRIANVLKSHEIVNEFERVVVKKFHDVIDNFSLYMLTIIIPSSFIITLIMCIKLYIYSTFTKIKYDIIGIVLYMKRY